MSPRFALKAATDDLHDKLDGLLGALDLADSTDYARFLTIQARTVPAVEQAMAEGGIERLLPHWGEWRRTQAIKSDLEALGITPPVPMEPPILPSEAALFGTAYVLEGSRLGARILVRRVGASMPNEFLSADGATSLWPGLIAAPDHKLNSDDLIDDASRSARACFALFLDASRQAGLK